MLVLTFQKKEISRQIKDRSYYVDLSKSTFAYTSIRFTKGYKKIINTLQGKDVDLLDNEGVLWGWVSNPSHEMVKNYLNKGYVAMFIDVDPSKCVISDYYKFTDYIMGDSSDMDFIVETPTADDMCLQCSFTVDSIYSIRVVYNSPFIVLYSSIARSFYAMQLLRGINERVNNNWYCGREFLHSLMYNWNKLQYIVNSVINSYRQDFGVKMNS